MLGLMILCGLLANAAGFGLLLWEIRSNRDRYKGWEGRKIPLSFWLYVCGMIVLAMGLTIFVYSFYKENTFLFTLKRVLWLALLWPIGYTDLKTLRIPNRMVVGGLAARALVLAAEFLFERDALRAAALGEGIASLSLFLAAAVCALLMKNAIGSGDRKLFLVMGLFLGLEGTWGAVFLSLLISFGTAVVLLVTRRKSRKDVIPFGPALMAGSYLSIFLTGM